MRTVDILAHENTMLLEQNEHFSLYLYSAAAPENVHVQFKSDQLAIFICLSGGLISSTETLSYHLSEKLVSFALRHNCKKIIPGGVLTELIIITFSQETLELLVESAGESVRLTMSHFTSCQCTVHNCTSEILELSRKLIKETTEKYWGHRIKSRFIFQELLVSFVRLFADSGSGENDTTAVVAKGLLDNYPDKNLDLEELAEQCGVSKSHLCRVFKKATGQTTSQYLNHVRIDRACKMLAETSVSIEEIALTAGFSNPSYFFRVFKKETGKLPLEWRKTHSVASEISTGNQNQGVSDE